MESRIVKPSSATTAEAGGPLVAAARTVESKSQEITDRLAHARAVVSDKTQEVGEKVALARGTVAAKSVGELLDSGRNVIRENPVNALLISAGIGALIGFAFGRRR